MLKKLLLIAGSLIIVGVIGSILSMNTIASRQAINETISLSFKNIDAVELTTVSTSIKVIGIGEDEEPYYTLIGDVTPSLLPNVTVDTTKHTLELEVEEAQLPSIIVTPFFNASPSLMLTLYVPIQHVKNMSLNSVTGDLSLENISLHALTFDTVSGDVTTVNSFSNETIADTTSGDILFQHSSEQFEVTTISGDIELHASDLQTPISINSVSGDVSLYTDTKPKDSHIVAQTVSGDVTIFGAETTSSLLGAATNVIQIETISGDIIVSD